MSNVLGDLGNQIHSLKAKFAEARKELLTEEEDRRPKIRPARLPYTGNQHQLERCD